MQSRPGKALIFALFSVSLAACGSKSGVQPSEVEASALQAQVGDPQVRAFYQARQWRAAWDKKSEKALTEIIAAAAANGLKPDLFLKGALPQDANGREAALTKAALGYASALARGYADPTKLGAVYTIPRPKAEVASGLAQALDKHDLEDWFASLAPQSDEYRALEQGPSRLSQASRASSRNADPGGQADQARPPRCAPPRHRRGAERGQLFAAAGQGSGAADAL